MRFGLSTYTYTWAFGVPDNMPAKPLNGFDLIDKAATHHLPCVQIADNWPLHILSTPELNSLHEYATVKNINIEVGTRCIIPNNLNRYITIAGQLQSPILRIVIDGSDFEPSVNEVIAIINNALPLLKEKGIKLAIENHDRFKAKEFEQMVLKTDPNWVGVCLDSVNSMGAAEGLEEVVKTLAPYTINLHLKEFIVKRVFHKMGFVVEGLPAGKGMLNIPWLINEVEKHGKCQSAILELWTPPENNINETIAKEEIWAVESINYLNNVIM